MNHLGVFAKYWQPGAVKTRLAASIGNENAAALYREFVGQTLDRFRQIGDSRSVWIWPPEKASEFSHVSGDNWVLMPQADGDLGAKMLDYFRQTLSSTNADTVPPKAVLIGTDSPDLPNELIERAFRELEKHDCVLGPSQDGGYFLIGMTRLISDLFEDMPWSTAELFTQSVARLNAAEVNWTQLPEWNDIDEFDDLKNLAEQLAKLPEPSPLDLRLRDAITNFGMPAR